MSRVSIFEHEDHDGDEVIVYSANDPDNGVVVVADGGAYADPRALRDALSEYLGDDRIGGYFASDLESAERRGHDRGHAVGYGEGYLAGRADPVAPVASQPREAAYADGVRAGRAEVLDLFLTLLPKEPR